MKQTRNTGSTSGNADQLNKSDTVTMISSGAVAYGSESDQTWFKFDRSYQNVIQDFARLEERFATSLDKLDTKTDEQQENFNDYIQQGIGKFKDKQYVKTAADSRRASAEHLGSVGLSDLKPSTDVASKDGYKNTIEKDIVDNDSIESAFATMDQLAGTIGRELNVIKQETANLQALRKSRATKRKIIFAAASIIFLIAGLVSMDLYFQHQIGQTSASAKKFLDGKNWNAVQNEAAKVRWQIAVIEKLYSIPIYRNTLGNLADYAVKDSALADTFTQDLVLSSEERSLYAFPVSLSPIHNLMLDLLMMERESLYRLGVTFFNQKKWQEAVQDFEEMQKFEKEYLSRIPIAGRSNQVSINTQKREHFYSKMSFYRKKRGLKQYFSNISSLLNDCLFYAGQEAMEKKNWSSAISYLSKLPSDEKYNKLLRKCKLELGRDSYSNKSSLIKPE